MKCHQVLTGACNVGDKTFGVGSVEGVSLIAYAAGCNITILANSFERVQIIPGICHNNVQITCVDVSNDTGKIAVAYENKVCVFEPTPLLTRDSLHGLDYWWVQTAQLDLECKVASLAWNHEGTRLLTAGDVLQMWRYSDLVKFNIGDKGDGSSSWECIWRVRPASSVVFLAFSADGTLFATAGRNDRLVRIWYQNQQLLLPNQSVDLAVSSESVTYSFIYVAHPRPVTGFSWRDTSRYMPRGAVANMLVTNCKDNICRLWSETVLPDDGLICMQQLDPTAAQDPHFRAHRQKQRFIQRLKHMRQSFTARKLSKAAAEDEREKSDIVQDPIPTLPSTYSIHDFHNFSFQGSGISPGLHFHLSATINALTDIPLVPAMNNSVEEGGVNHKFVLHWLNNKEIYFSTEAGKILRELAKMALKREDSGLEQEMVEEGGEKGKEPDKQSRDGLGIIQETGSGGGMSHAPSITSFNTDISQPSSVTTQQLSLSEALDQRIESLLREWHQSSDLLFSVHPVDGSLLVWVADFLDEYQPGEFRQAQVSFSSRIPNAIPIGDASTMSSNISVFNPVHILNLNDLIKDKAIEEAAIGNVEENANDEDGTTSMKAPDMSVNKFHSVNKKYDASPVISMISKHENGSLNLWDVTFSPETNFSQLLNISHKARVNGHRFRVNDITSHPVLPLLLTTSHHNMTTAPTGPISEQNFCSELILWKVSSISPLSRPGSGGISELARINSKQVSAFTNVAWIPTLLPSTVLGSMSNSPSACFVSSDGSSLRVYQAVIDARSLLAELNSSARQDPRYRSTMSMASDQVQSPAKSNPNYASFSSSIVSAQSSARPGVVLELDQISDAQQNWQNTLLLHTFQAEMVSGSPDASATGMKPKLGLIPSSMSAMVDLRGSKSGFAEMFFVVVAEKTSEGALMHTWQLELSSTGEEEEDQSARTSRSVTPDMVENKEGEVGSRVMVSTAKICTQSLPLPPNTEVIHCVPAAGHLSSSSIYPACLAPYLLVTACSDNKIRFWRTGQDYQWEEWEMESGNKESSIDVPGVPVSVSAAYSGRIAVAYRAGHSFHRKTDCQDPTTSYVNLYVAIYECESTGGSEWVLEDRIMLKNVEVPKVDLALDKTVFQPQDKKQAAMAKIQKNLYDSSKHDSDNYWGGRSSGSLAKVPSQATMSKLRDGLPDVCGEGLVQKRLVQLDWVSNEDGSHILTVSVANKVMLLTTVSSEIAQANMTSAAEARKELHKSNQKRPLLRKSSSIGLQPVVDEWRWMTFRRIELKTADGLPPLPMAVSWARDGVLMCAMENEVSVYSQWKSEEELEERFNEIAEEADHRRLKDEDLFNMAQESQLRNITSGGKLASGANMKYLSEAEDKARETQMIGEEDLMPDVGLFEASHLACPVLPQYHPKQLMELLNSGKIRWVKAILSHLVKSITPDRQIICTGDSSSPRDWSKSRTLSLSVNNMERSPSPKRSSTSAMPEELTLDYSEIRTVPPLPLWTLLAADKEKGSAQESKEEYNELFSTEAEPESLTLDFNIDDDDLTRHERRTSVAAEKQGLSYFGPRQARLLSKLLTHTQLPGLTSLDQMHLLALADTVASCNLDLAERFAIDAAKNALKESLTTTGETSLESLDDCGLRCLLAMKNHCYLKRCLPIGQRATLSKRGLNTSNIIWGFHSESEEELVSLVPGVQKGNLSWGELKELGVVWWVRNNNVLRKLVETLAKAAFQKENDPLDAALFYLAMKKKSLVWGLFRSKRDEKMTQFFKNDFKEERWRKAALKNAFALLGKQRFLHAAAFFLLSGSLKDALDIIIFRLDDLQLAILVGRLYEGGNDNNPPSVVAILKKYILGVTEGSEEFDNSQAHPDPFYRSMAFWIIRDYESSLTTLVQTNIGENHPKFTEDESVVLKKKHEVDPCVFNFYVYLRTHPLILRQRVAKRSEDKSKALMLSGFKSNSTEKATTFSEDAVTPLERRLFFTTAHFHLRSGCPALALEVLSKLPANVAEAEEIKEVTKETSKAAHMETGNLNEDNFDWSSLGRVSPKVKEEKVAVKSEDFGLDWGASLISAPKPEEDELKLDWSDDDDDDDDEDDDDLDENKISTQAKSIDLDDPDVQAVPSKIDIMAQQLKFMACLKIMMEELSTLATGFEVDGGMIRYQLYIWLEKEVDALNELCNYGGSSKASELPVTEVIIDNKDDEWKRRPTLHQVILNEKMDFETRLTRTARRKKWLIANQTLLRTLLSYCGLHGANGGGLASVGMELILLLQELQQEQTQHQLLSPLPFPTTLPLLSACIAQQKTVVIDPIHHLQTLSHDMLYRLYGHKALPVPGSAKYSSIFLIRDLSVALSSCVYQSMCDSDTSNTKRGADLGLPEAVNRLSVVMADSYLMFSPNQRKQSIQDEETRIVTEPCKWPGVTALRALLDRDKDDDTPNLNVLLCENYAAVYLSLLVYGLATCDCHILFRLVSQVPSGQVWAQIFGGGTRKQLNTEINNIPQKEAARTGSEEGENILTTGISTVTNITKQRIKLNMKLLNVQLGTSPQDNFTEKAKKPTYKELFVPPEMSIVSKLMSKTSLDTSIADIDYDSGVESEHEGEDYEYDDEDDDPFSNVPPKAANKEHSDPDSYAWAIMRLAVLNLAQKNIETFILSAGIELAELPIASSLIYRCLRTTERWANIIVERLMRDGKPPDNFIPGCFSDSTATGPIINKYRAMLEPHNTPFPSVGSGLGPIKRLWRFLVHQEPVQCIFIRYIFGKSKPAGSGSSAREVVEGDVASRVGDESILNYAGDEKEGKMRVIHKEQDNITAFCINKVSSGLIAVSTPREILEVNMNILLHPSAWSDRADDEAENDILHMQEEAVSGSRPAPAFQPPPGDPFQFMSGLGSGATSMATSPSGSQPSTIGTKTETAVRASHVVKRHKCDGVRRLVAHPHLPLYISGGQDGAVALWEWSHNTQVATVRPGGIFAKVNRIVFTQQGNKFGVCDGDGNTALWQAANTSAPYFSQHTHTRNTADFVFQGGSSSLLATAGHNHDGRNVALWDTLLQPRKACVQSYTCHDAGASSLLHASQHQLLISAGKKGQICIWDIRQAKLLNTFKAHDHAVKCLAMDANETILCTGSVDGDLKVWDLTWHKAVHSFPGEHARHGLFKNISQGVAQVALIEGTLYSCGADGSMKMRKLPERDVFVNWREVY